MTTPSDVLSMFTGYALFKLEQGDLVDYTAVCATELLIVGKAQFVDPYLLLQTALRTEAHGVIV
jgi:hypothetical protein